MASLNSSTESELEDVDIAIVGGGMVGLCMALSLTRAVQEAGTAQVRIALIDAQPKAKQQTSPKAKKNKIKDVSFDHRVSALTVASETLLSRLGVWNKVTALGACPYAEMFVWDAEGTGSIHFAAADVQESRLGHIVENRLITEALNEVLVGKKEREQGIELIRPENVCSLETLDDSAGTRHTLTLESGRRLRCKLIIAADGGNSFIREQANFKTRAWDYQHQAIVTTVKTEKPHNFTATQCFMPSGPLAFLPLLNLESAEPDQQLYSSIVWSCGVIAARNFRKP